MYVQFITEINTSFEESILFVACNKRIQIISESSKYFSLFSFLISPIIFFVILSFNSYFSTRYQHQVSLFPSILTFQSIYVYIEKTENTFFVYMTKYTEILAARQIYVSELMLCIPWLNSLYETCLGSKKMPRINITPKFRIKKVYVLLALKKTRYI